MRSYEQEHIRQLRRINGQLNPGPALLKFWGLIIVFLALILTCGFLVGSLARG